jgi:hypothetical protein
MEKLYAQRASQLFNECDIALSSSSHKSLKTTPGNLKQLGSFLLKRGFCEDAKSVSLSNL